MRIIKGRRGASWLTEPEVADLGSFFFAVDLYQDGDKDTQIIASDPLLPFSCELTAGLVCADVHMFMIQLPVSSTASSGLKPRS